MPMPRRRKLFVDRAVQGALIGRALSYWVACLLFVTVPLCIGRVYAHPDQFIFQQFGALWKQFGPVLTCAVLMLPLVVYDLLQLTNRFVGPLVRLRREMQRLAAGERVRPLRFRKGDFWQDLTIHFNRLVERCEQTAVEPRPAAPPRDAVQQPALTAAE